MLVTQNTTLATRIVGLRSYGTPRNSGFCPQSDNITNYLEQVELFFIANDVPEAKQAAALLSAIGSKPHSNLKNLLAPDLPSSKSFEALKNTLKSALRPQTFSNWTEVQVPS